MITLNQIADLFIHDFSGGDPSKDSQLDRRDIVLKVRSYINAIIKVETFNKKAEGDNSAVASAIGTYQVTLQQDDTEQKYVDIPDFYLTLPNNKGIHRLYVKGNPFEDFIIQHNPGITSNLPHMKLKGLQFCYVEGNKIKMGKGCTAKKADALILQLIVPVPDSIGPNDPLPILKEYMPEVMTRLKADYAPLMAIPNDYANNQNTNIR